MVQGTGAGLAAGLAGCSGDGGSGGGSGSGDGGSDGGSGGGGGYGGGTDDGSGDGGGSGGSEVHVLTDYTAEAWQEAWENEIVPGFEEETGIPVEVEYVGMQGPGEQRLLTLMQAGDAPELYCATSAQVANLIVEGQTRQVGGAVDSLEEQNGEMLFRNTVELGGETHLMPHGLFTGGTFNYRTDIYEKLSLEVPETWDDLLANAEAIEEDSDIEARGFAISAVKAGKSGSDWANFFRNAGGGLFRWKSDSEEEAEIWFDESHGVEALEYMNQLAEYSPDPSSISWAGTLKNWAAGRIGQTVMNNAHNAGVAYGAGAKSVALNTDVALVPKKSGSDPIDRGWALLDGTPVIEAADNPEGGKRFWQYMYDTPEKVVNKIHIAPMRFLPPYEDLVHEDAYKSAEIFQVEDGYFWELNRTCIEEIAPELASEERPTTPGTYYQTKFQYDSEIINQVLVGGKSPQQGYQDCYDELERLFEEGKQKAEGNF